MIALETAESVTLAFPRLLCRKKRRR